MNKRVIVYVLGAVLLIEAALMLLPLLVAVIYREKNGWYFLWVLLGAAVLGALARGLGGRKRSAMYAKEGLIAVALSWIVLSLVGALPFTLSGQIPFYLDAVFEITAFLILTASLRKNMELRQVRFAAQNLLQRRQIHRSHNNITICRLSFR